MSEIKGYGANDYVKENYKKLKEIIARIGEGELVDLIGCVQVELGLKEDKAREYAFGAVSSRWIEVSNHGHVIDTLTAKQNLKYLRPVHFRSLLGKMEKRFNVEKMEHEMRPLEEPPSETPFTDDINKERQETIKRNLEKLGYK